MQPQASPSPAPTAQPDLSQFGNYSNWAKQNLDSGVPLSEVQQTYQQHIQGQPQQGNKGGGNWFTHLLPTAGGILGGIVGGAADVASLGALAPLINPITGAAAGGALGQAGENLADHQKVLQGNDLTTGLESGVGEGLGGLAGKVLGKGADLALGRAKSLEGAASDAAANQAAQDTAKATRNNFGNAGSSGFRSANNLEGNQNLLDEWGVDKTDPVAMNQAGKGGLFIHNVDQEALAAGNPIPTSSVISSKNIVDMTPEEQQAAMNAGIIDNTGKVSATITPQQADSFASDLSSQVRTAKGIMSRAEGGTNIDEYNAAKTNYNQLLKQYNQVKDAAATPEVNAAIKDNTVSLQEKDDLVKQFGQKEADYIEQQVNDAQTHQDLVKAKLPFAQMNDLSNVAQNAAKDSASAPAVAREVAANGVPEAPGNPISGPKTVHSILTGDGGMVSKGLQLGAHAIDNPAMLKTLNRMGGLTSKIAAPIGAGIGASNNALQQNNGIVGGAMQQPGSITSGLPVPQQAPQQGLSRDDLITLALYSPGSLSSLAPSAQQTQNVTSANTAMSALNGLGSAPSGGLMSQLQGHLGIGGTGEYQQKAAAAAQQIAAALPGSNPAAIEKQLTDYAAGGGNIDEAIATLKQNLQGVLQSNQNTGLSGILGVGAGAPQSLTSQLVPQ